MLVPGVDDPLLVSMNEPPPSSSAAFNHRPVINKADGCYSHVFANRSFSITRIYGNANILLMTRGETGGGR